MDCARLVKELRDHADVNEQECPSEYDTLLRLAAERLELAMVKSSGSIQYDAVKRILNGETEGLR